MYCWWIDLSVDPCRLSFCYVLCTLNTEVKNDELFIIDLLAALTLSERGIYVSLEKLCNSLQ